MPTEYSQCDTEYVCMYVCDIVVYVCMYVCIRMYDIAEDGLDTAERAMSEMVDYAISDSRADEALHSAMYR